MIPKGKTQRGFTLIELIAATTILVTLTLLAIPLATVSIKRVRDGIDRYKDTCDRAAFRSKAGSECYPPDLDTLVNGEDVNGKKLKFLRRIPIDPMTHTTDWGIRSWQDDPNSDSWSGDDVFDVYSKSQRTALDGTKYKDW
ncbi:MAG: general secretion pathway protein GspG [Acidobacteria bacterium]|nr:MAG: general secretion pathway protein GspG [Acidobacteriota bacterium]